MRRPSPLVVLVVALGALANARCSSSGAGSGEVDQAASGGVFTGSVHPVASSALCLDVVGQGTANGTQVQVWSCAGSTNQRWTYDGTHLRVYGNKCLDMTNGVAANGTKLQIWDCTPGNPNQAWTLGGSALRLAGTDMCMDLTGGVAADGTLAQSWSCGAGNRNQQWIFPAPAPGGSSSGGGGGSSGSSSGSSSSGGSGGSSGSSSSGSGSGGSSGGGGSCPPSWTTTPSCGGATGSGTAPDFGPNVLVFDPSMSMSSIQGKLDSLYAKMDADQFDDQGTAVLFTPGQYSLDVQVGFYTHVMGLGRSPDDVTITGAVRAKADWLGNNNATCNFWRTAENLAVVPTQAIDNGVDTWATSQGTALRRIHVKGSIVLEDNGGWASGGFIADSKIDTQIASGSQQQYLTRNVDLGHWQGANWNMVFVGDRQPPSGTWPNPPYTVVAATPVVREKPFLYVDAGGHYLVMVPGLKTGSTGSSWGGDAPGNPAPPGSPLSIDRFYVAHPGTDTAATINAALAQGRHLLLTPGHYPLDAPIQVTQAGTVVLGLGLPVLTATRGNAALTVADVDGVSVAGLLVEAGPTDSPTLVQIGPPGSSASHAADPTVFFDVHCRVGGNITGSADVCVTVNSHDVVVDDSWLWRADHARGGVANGWYDNRSQSGIVVNGDRVTAYGLFSEHHQQFQTLWNGNGGAVYFYQSEMPYDPPSQGAWMEPGGANGYASYKVASGVTSHTGEGIGVYSFFSSPVHAANAVETPSGAGIAMHHMMTFGSGTGGIDAIINGTGGPSTAYSGD